MEQLDGLLGLGGLGEIDAVILGALVLARSGFLAMDDGTDTGEKVGDVDITGLFLLLMLGTKDLQNLQAKVLGAASSMISR